jgi:hypothetical protein
MRQAVIHSFAMVARPIILEYFPPRSCISSTRIVIECLQAFGILARPIPVQFSLCVPSQKLAYLACGPDELSRARQHNQVVELKPFSGAGWPGHLIALAEGRYWIDASFDQAFHSFVDAGRLAPGIETPQIHVLELRLPLPDGEFALDALGEMEGGAEVRITYTSLADESYRQCAAWEFDTATQAASRRIVRRMQRYLRGKR